MAGAEPSSPEPPHAEQHIRGSPVTGMTPLPRQTVQVSVLIAPVPRQCAQRARGVETITVPRPPQTQQVESEDMMPKGSLPAPRQKAQMIVSICDSFHVMRRILQEGSFVDADASQILSIDHSHPQSPASAQSCAHKRHHAPGTAVGL